MSARSQNVVLASAIAGVLAVSTLVASAQTTLTWIGNQTNSANVSGANNWLNGTAPANDAVYHFVFSAANLVLPGTNVPRTSAIWNRAAGVLALAFVGNSTYPAFTFSATSGSMMPLKGGITAELLAKMAMPHFVPAQVDFTAIKESIFSGACVFRCADSPGRRAANLG